MPTRSAADAAPAPVPALAGAGASRATPDSTRVARFVTIPIIAAVVLIIGLAALVIGRYVVPPEEVVRLLLGQVLPIERTWYDQEQTVVLEVRLPRVVLSVLVGGGLAVCGAVLQGVFRNPLVSPQFVGVSAGASFGGAVALLLGLGTIAVVGGALAFGLVALALVMMIGRISSASPLLMIVLGGVVISAFFTALVSLVTYVADPYTALPIITFWLLGSLATASFSKVLTILVAILIGGTIIAALRWRLNVLSLGDEDAAALGVSPRATRNALLFAVALITAGAVAVSGVVGWVGLVVPHITRLLVGSDNRVLLPASLLVGGGYLTLIDTISRSLTSSEVPLGILTAIIGAPFFIILLTKFRKRVWIGA